MIYGDLEAILRAHAMRITACRIDVLDSFLGTGHALSFKDLEGKLTQYDRVTLYRTLNSFIDKGIIHKIFSDSGFISFGICYDTCSPHHHHHNHVHFKCDACGNIECLPSYHVPVPEISGYKITEANLLVNGLCSKCISN
ncbi:MAG: transcriptional repressor [Bacteroidetes bacterium]|nr:transcriptional repressor [Bacteroidota bacterium]MDA1119450.1 transcriptional repressor [Bacteroidota bacterium]